MLQNQRDDALIKEHINVVTNIRWSKPEFLQARNSREVTVAETGEVHDTITRET